ncbi:MAG: hypothetical protein JRN52_11040 [Nitrososphaerota archaeon]|nr:hypothetical protein [Nitrososphaerota archaeon]
MQESSVHLPLRDVEILRHSEIVKRILSTSFDGIADAYVLKIRAELTNGWLLDYFEHGTPVLRRYSYHVFHERMMIVRWDNAPHHRRLKGFPLAR